MLLKSKGITLYKLKQLEEYNHFALKYLSKCISYLFILNSYNKYLQKKVLFWVIIQLSHDQHTDNQQKRKKTYRFILFLRTHVDSKSSLQLGVGLLNNTNIVTSNASNLDYCNHFSTKLQLKSHTSNVAWEIPGSTIEKLKCQFQMGQYYSFEQTWMLTATTRVLQCNTNVAICNNVHCKGTFCFNSTLHHLKLTNHLYTDGYCRCHLKFGSY